MEYERVMAEVDLSALVHNMREITKTLPEGTRIMAVVKADAYGHGAVPVAGALAEAGVDALGVAICEEGVALRESGISIPILILGGVSKEGARQAILHKLTQTVFNLRQAETISEAASALCKNAEVHVKIDSGMARLGFLPDDQGMLDIMLACRMPGILPTGIFSHFAFSDGDSAYTARQYRRFLQAVDNLEKQGQTFLCKHISNSGAILNEPDLSLDMVRAGIILYGVRPPEKHGLDVRPVLSLKSRLVQVNRIKAGESVGYNRTYVTCRETLVGVVPVGYADGYSRLHSNRGTVLIRGRLAPIIGNICMDMFMVDVTEIEGAEAGDEAVLIGRQGALEITAGDLAELTGTIGYEVLCKIGGRVPRKYIN